MWLEINISFELHKRLQNQSKNMISFLRYEMNKKKRSSIFKHAFYQLKKPQATCRTTSIPDIVPIRPKSVRLWSKFHILHLERNFQTSSQRLRPQHLTAFLSSNHQKNNKSKEACPWELIKMRSEIHAALKRWILWRTDGQEREKCQEQFTFLLMQGQRFWI